MIEIRGAVSNERNDKFIETDKPASYVYTSLGSDLQTYCDVREDQYLDLMSRVWNMIDLGSQCVNNYISANWQ